MFVRLLRTCLCNHIDNSSRSGTTCQTGKDMNINLIFVGNGLYLIVLSLQSRKILIAISSKKDTACTTLLSRSLSNLTQRILHGSTILHNAFQSGIVGNIIEYLL